MQQILGDPESGCLDLETYHLALAIAKKILDENRFKHTHKRQQTALYLILKLAKEYTSKTSNLEDGISNGEMVTGLSV